MKKKIFFVPNYIGTLRYYEKLFPRLSGEYECAFLFISPNPSWRRVMVAYCEERHYRHETIDDSIGRWRVPFFTALRKHKILFKRCGQFLERERPAKIVSIENDKLYLTQALFTEANARGVETIVLQWALNAYHDIRIIKAAQKLKPEDISLLRRIYFFLLKVVGRILGIYNDSFEALKRSSPVKVGIINEQARKAYVAQGYPAESIQVVGHIDSQLVMEEMNRIRSDELYRKKIYEKYRLPLDKENIIVISSMFNRKDVRVFTNEQQIKYFKAIFKTIRSIFPETTHTIMFKLHPSEHDLYNQGVGFGVIVLPDSANIVEVVALSNLYVAHPHTAVNFMAITARKPSLFVNFQGFEYFNMVKDYYGITYVISSHAEFAHLLADAKEGKLHSQYKITTDSHNSLDRIVDFIQA